MYDVDTDADLSASNESASCDGKIFSLHASFHEAPSVRASSGDPSVDRFLTFDDDKMEMHAHTSNPHVHTPHMKDEDDEQVTEDEGGHTLDDDDQEEEQGNDDAEEMGDESDDGVLQTY